MNIPEPAATNEVASGCSPLPSFSGRDWLTAMIVFLIAFGARVPCRSHMAFDWDCAQFALTIGQYDIAKSLPHPPGYFLYVMLGRLVNLFVGEPYTALVWMSVVCGSALAAVMYLLGAAMFGRAAGGIAALVGVSSPLLWFYSLVARNYILDGLAVTVFALLCWKARARGVGWRDVVVLSVVLAFTMGERQQSGLTLLPLFLYTVWGHPPHRVLRIFVALLLVGVFVLAWFIPLVAITGGLRRYFEIARAHLQGHNSHTVWEGGLPAALRNLMRMLAFSIDGLLLGAPLLGLAYLLRVRSIAAVITRRAVDARVLFCVVWLGPMIAFWALVFTDIPGHVVSYLCGFAVLVGASIVVLAGQIAVRTGVGNSLRVATILLTAVMIGMNVWVFLFRPAVTLGYMTGEAVTYPDVLENDRQLAAVCRLVRERFDPEQVLLCHAKEFTRWNLRQFQYHLPEYRNVQLQRDPSLPAENAGKLWLGYERRTEFIEELDVSGQTRLLLVVPPGWEPDVFLRYLDLTGIQPVAGADGRLYSVPVQARHYRPL